MDPVDTPVVKDLEASRAKLTDARDEALAATNSAQTALDLMPDPPTPPVIVEPPIDSADAFDRALATAAPFAVLTLPASFRYPGPIVIRKPVTIVSETFDARRDLPMTIDEPAPAFLGSVDLLSDDVQWLGLEARQINPLGDILKMRGARQVLDRPRILGDPQKGAHNGITYDGAAGAIRRAYITDIFTDGRETHGLYTREMGPGGLTIDQSFICAAGIPIMIGGDDASSEARLPRGVRITRSILTKKPSWLDVVSGAIALGTARHRYTCKGSFEVKAGIDIVIDGCLLEYAGTSEGQPSALAVFTPRNQYGRAPFTTVAQVRMTNCLGRFGGTGVHFLGDDNRIGFPTLMLTDVTVWNCQFEDLEPARWGGPGRVFYINRGTVGVHLEAITASGVGLKSAIYCDERKPPVGLVARNFKMPVDMRYRYHNLNGDTLASLQLYAPDAVLDIKAGDVGASLVGSPAR